MGCQYFLLFAIDSLSQCFLHALPTCYLSCHTSSRRAASLPASLADPPSTRHPCRFPVCLRRHPSLPCSCPPIARSRISTPVAAFSRTAASSNSVYIIQLRLHHLTPSIPYRRQDKASARLSCRMAPRRAGRVSMACPFGAYRHGSRW